MRVLLIEDDLMLGQALVHGFQRDAMAVDWETDRPSAQSALLEKEHAVVILDAGLPDVADFDLLSHARSNGVHCPIIIISARGEVESRIMALELGADDYLTKPFEVRELIARIHAVVRRRSGQTNSIVSIGAVALDMKSHKVRYRGVEHILPAREYALLLLLLRHPDTILSRAQIEREIYSWNELVESNAVDVLIHSIRQKFDKDIVRNVRGAGWMVTRSESP
jgi:DNA-binding response OmpR family regulator